MLASNLLFVRSVAPADVPDGSVRIRVGVYGRRSLEATLEDMLWRG
jgi:hypothetical protein